MLKISVHVGLNLDTQSAVVNSKCFVMNWFNTTYFCKIAYWGNKFIGKELFSFVYYHSLHVVYILWNVMHA